MTALLLLDVILIVWAVGRPTGVEAGSRTPAPAVDRSTEPTASPAPTDAGQPSDEPSDAPTNAPVTATIATVPTQRILTALDGDVAWRATTGDCPAATASPELSADGDRIERTTDRGASWL